MIFLFTHTRSMKLINKIRIKKMLVVFTTIYRYQKKILAKREDVINKYFSEIYIYLWVNI